MQPVQASSIAMLDSPRPPCMHVPVPSSPTLLSYPATHRSNAAACSCSKASSWAMLRPSRPTPSTCCGRAVRCETCVRVAHVSRLERRRAVWNPTHGTCWRRGTPGVLGWADGRVWEAERMHVGASHIYKLQFCHFTLAWAVVSRTHGRTGYACMGRQNGAAWADMVCLHGQTRWTTCSGCAPLCDSLGQHPH
eukprot:360078-Chlamydomonas_euryale.AAC.5